MPQSTLNFAASKRTASASNIGKSKVSAFTTKPLGRTDGKVLAATTESGVEEDDKYDDIEQISSSEEDEDDDDVEEADDITSARYTDSDKKDDSSVGTPTVIARTTRSKTRNTVTLVKKPSESKQKAKNATSSPGMLKPSNLKAEDLAKKVEATAADGVTNEPPALVIKDKKWNKQYGAAKAKMGGLPTIHNEKENKITEILRVFDNSYEYGPCVGMSRLERWERAEALGMNPPREIYEILTTKEGKTQDEYKESVFHGQV